MIDTGLVVQGPDGSEFVWVPVSDINSMAQCSKAGGDCNLELVNGVLKCTNEAHSSTAENIIGKLYATELGENFGVENTTYSENNGLREPVFLNNATYGDNNNTIGLTQESLKNDYNAMATSVEKNGGFYIGRYETSLEGATATQVGTGNVQSKGGVLPNSAADTETSTWYGLYRKQNKTYTGTNNSVVSSMIWVSQYYAMLNWINSSNSSDKYKITQKTNGNHTESRTVTGSNSYRNDNINNIRDLEGNLREWSLGASGYSDRLLFGGGINYYFSPSCCYNANASLNRDYRGSRLTLYIK